MKFGYFLLYFATPVELAGAIFCSISKDDTFLGHFGWWKESKGIPVECPNSTILYIEYLPQCLEDIEAYQALVKEQMEILSKAAFQRGEQEIFQESICHNVFSNDTEKYLRCRSSRNYEYSCQMMYPNVLSKYKDCIRGFRDIQAISYKDEYNAKSELYKLRETGPAEFVLKRKRERVRASKSD